MNIQELWLIPLILLPGVALLILSTSTRFSRLHDEIHHQLEHGGGDNLEDLVLRARLFRNSLVCLYVCVMLFAAGSLMGGIGQLASIDTLMPEVILTGMGILSLFAASVILVRESVLSYEVIKKHLS